MTYPPFGTIWRAFVVLMLLFMPVAVTAPGGNIPVVFPWWLAVLGIWLPTEPGVEFSAASIISTILVVPLAMWVIEREVRREHADEKNHNGGAAV